MAMVVYQWSGNGVARMIAALEPLADNRKATALMRAMNKVGDISFTAVKKTLAKQIGGSKGVRKSTALLLSNGRSVNKRLATTANLEYAIVSRGPAIRMAEFKYTAHKKGGVVAWPWGQRHQFRTAFEIRSGAAWGTGKLKQAGLYRRRTKARFPLEALYGPNINKELVKDATAAAFETIFKTRLQPRVEHEVKQITKGVLS
jgi:hypothetical protein